MIILGDRIKELRKQKKLTQKKLAEGVCTQVTISKIENKNSIPTIRILTKICERLNVQIEDVVVVEDESNENYDLLKEIGEFIRLYKFDSAEKCLNKLDEGKLISKYEKKLFYYYKGFLLSNQSNETEEALSFLNLALLIQSNSQAYQLLDALTTNIVAILYLNKEELERARVYFNKTLEDIEKIDFISESDFENASKIYYNNAKFYSEVNDYFMALELLEKGIELALEAKLIERLDRLYYEKAFNLAKLNKNVEAEKNYLISMGFAQVNQNNIIIKIIKKDLKTFNLSFESEMR